MLDKSTVLRWWTIAITKCMRASACRQSVPGDSPTVWTSKQFSIERLWGITRVATLGREASQCSLMSAMALFVTFAISVPSDNTTTCPDTDAAKASIFMLRRGSYGFNHVAISPTTFSTLDPALFALWRLAKPFAKPGPRCSRVMAGLLAILLYPSAAPVHTFSCNPRTARISEIESRAPTTCISVVPGLAKQLEIPQSAAHLISTSAPFIVSRSFAYVLISCNDFIYGGAYVQFQGASEFAPKFLGFHKIPSFNSLCQAQITFNVCKPNHI